MSAEARIEITVLSAVAELPASDWDACANPPELPYNPFVSHKFLKALEDSGSVGQGTGWVPRHLIARLDGVLIGVMPLYAKGNSQGEYIFDHSWANAYERAGGRYYPKLQAAVPFTPVTGRRLLVRPEHTEMAQAALVQGAVQLTEQNSLSSLHITFCSKEEFEVGQKMGLLHRTGQQFHWENAGYPDFTAFLAQLSSRKRKNIVKERRQAQQFGGRIVQLTGDQIEPEHWDAFWQFYQDTGARKWGQPYLTRAFFDCIHESMRDDILLILAERDGRWVAGALNFIGGDALYGRYWGCIEDHACLHFELCYYQAIDFAIEHNLARVEAGAQGEHKLARGYLPTPVYSLHWIADPGLRDAIDRYLQQERAAVEEEIEILTDYGPFRKTDTPQEHD